jgi:hypothetical protein
MSLGEIFNNPPAELELNNLSGSTGKIYWI